MAVCQSPRCGLSRALPAWIALLGTLLAASEHANAAALTASASYAWSFEPWSTLPIVLTAASYGAGLLRMGRDRRRRIVGPMRTIAFALGIVTLIGALLSPLDSLAEDLFSAHMLQHLLLMLVAPPLLVWARPGIVLLWAFPIGARRGIGRLWTRAPDVAAAFDRIMRPLNVYILASMAFWFWHLPRPYDVALASEPIHIAEHLCLFATSLALWTVVVEPYGIRRLGYAWTFAFVATFALQGELLGALLTFAAHPLYAAYAHEGTRWGLTALEDQQLAGVFMWVPASTIQIAALGVLFVAGLRHAEAREIAAARTQ